MTMSGLTVERNDDALDHSAKNATLGWYLWFVNPSIPKLARALGFEPRSKVLETSILPLNYARLCTWKMFDRIHHTDIQTFQEPLHM